MLVGYARISTGDQNLDLQLDALKQAGFERIFTDEISGSKSKRPGLGDALDFVRAGDTLVVWRLDRLGRSLKDLIRRIDELKGGDINFRSLHEHIDTGSSTGKLIFHVIGALAEFERDLIRERTKAGLKAARARGRHGGRPRGMTPKKIELAAQMMSDPNKSIAEICQTLGISSSTLYRYVSKDGQVLKR